MDAMPPQRVDIAQIVGEYHGKSPRQAREDVEHLERRVAPRGRERAAAAGTWYVVVDEILEGRVTLEAWPWPEVSEATGYLDFDLSRTVRFTREGEDVHRVVAEHRRAHDDEPVAGRPLRIGDVFEVETTDVADLSSWAGVRDHTKDKRAEARAALDAMAAPPHPPGKATELERMAREQDPEPESAVQPTSAHAAV